MEIPLRNRRREVVGVALIDDDDYPLVAPHSWYLNRDGYARTTIGGRGGLRITMHRLILGFSRGDGNQTDHVNRDRLDNRRENLRPATHALNHQNKPANRGSSSQFRGVSREGGKWRAVVRLNGKNHHLGFYEDEVEAARVASAWRAEHMPFAVEGIV